MMATSGFGIDGVDVKRFARFRLSRDHQAIAAFLGPGLGTFVVVLGDGHEVELARVAGVGKGFGRCARAVGIAGVSVEVAEVDLEGFGAVLGTGVRAEEHGGG